MVETKKIVVKVNCTVPPHRQTIQADVPEIITEWHVGRIIFALGLLLGLLVIGVMVFKNNKLFSGDGPVVAALPTASATESGQIDASTVSTKPVANPDKSNKPPLKSAAKNKKVMATRYNKVKKKHKTKKQAKNDNYQ